MKKTIACICLVALSAVCVSARADSPQPVQDSTAPIRKRAEALLEILRSGQWSKAAGFVVVSTGRKDAETRHRMGIPKDATSELISQKVVEWFKQLYGTVKPGRVVEVRIDPRDKGLALIEYMHEDKDGFYMRRVDAEWYYTLDEKAEPDAPANGNQPSQPV